MGDLGDVLMALAAVLVPLALAWWLLRDRKGLWGRGRHDDSHRPPG